MELSLSWSSTQWQKKKNNKLLRQQWQQQQGGSSQESKCHSVFYTVTRSKQDLFMGSEGRQDHLVSGTARGQEAEAWVAATASAADCEWLEE